MKDNSIKLSLSAEEYISLAKKASSKSIEREMAYYHKAIEVDPNCAEAHILLGECFSRIGELDLSSIEYFKAYMSNPTDEQLFRINISLGTNALHIGNVDLAAYYAEFLDGDYTIQTTGSNGDMYFDDIHDLIEHDIYKYKLIKPVTAESYNAHLMEQAARFIREQDINKALDCLNKGADSSFVGIISTDLSLLRLSRSMSEMKPYPHSYFMMIDEEGRYFVHPDSTRLFKQTIFTGADTRKQADLIVLGHEMTSGKRGNMMVKIDGSNCIVCYQPVPGTSWSLGIVCPDSDVMAGYHKLSYIVGALLVIGLLVIILLCYRALGHTISPLYQLLDKSQIIASGNMEVYIPRTTRTDVIGRLQNSFASMLESLNFHMGSVRYISEQTQRKNEELLQATQMVQEADRQKTAFIQNVTHQIRTPLNIIMGFTQVIGDTGGSGLSDEEKKSITDTMSHNASQLARMVQMLFDSSDTGLSQELESHKSDHVSCNDVAREAVSYVKLHYPDVNINIETQLADDFCIMTNHLYLMRALRELLYNSSKHSDGQHVLLRVLQAPALWCAKVGSAALRVRLWGGCAA